MTKPAPFPLALALLAVGCAPPPPDMEAELTALRAAANAYHEAASAKDAARVVALYDQDAVMVPPNADLVEGLEGVQGYRFGFISTPGIALRFELVRAEVSQSADMGWTLAIADITIDHPDGPPTFSLVRDFHTWKKQADGSWKVIGDVWNTGPEPAADSTALNPG
jgi:ketosteroid isomerase-like protein